MRCEVKSGGPMLGVMAAVIALFLVLLPLIVACLNACVSEPIFFFFYIIMQCSI